MLLEDFRHEPELVPGVQRSRYSTLVGSGSDLFESVAITLVRIAWIPADLYRYALKATFWFYWPLIFVTGQGNLRDVRWRQAWVRKRSDITERFALASAFFVLATALLFPTLPSVARDVTATLEAAAPVVPLTWLLLVDWREIAERPWQWFSLTNAALTIALFCWLSQVRSYADEDRKLIPLDGWQVGVAVSVKRLILTLFIGYWLVALWHITKFSLQNGRLGFATPYAQGAMDFLALILHI